VLDLWISIARRLLKLPEGDPTFQGDPAKVETWNPDPGYLRYQLLGFWIGSIPLLALAGASFAGVVLIHTVTRLDVALRYLAATGFGLLGLLIVAVIAFNYAAVHLEFDMLRYTLTQRAIRLRRGVSKIEEVTLSYANIQNVQYQQGPLQRWFGIADLIVQTAGGGGGMQPGTEGQVMLGHRGLIKGVGRPEELRELILSRVRKVKGAGLGDRRDAKPVKPRGAGSVDSPAGRALLAEIRDALAAVNRARA